MKQVTLSFEKTQVDYHSKVIENQDLKKKLDSPTLNADFPNFEKSGVYFKQTESLIKEVQSLKVIRS